MQDGGTGAGAQHGGARGQPHFVLPPSSTWTHPGRGDFSVSNLTALSLGDLRRRIEALMQPDDVEVRLNLDRAARLERDRRRRRAAIGERASPRP